MRILLPLASLGLAACTVSERLSDPYAPDPVVEVAPERSVGFLRLADAGNPGHGVAPDIYTFGDEVVPIGWASMGDRLCEIDGLTGTIGEDVYLPGDPPTDDPDAEPTDPIELFGIDGAGFLLRDGSRVRVVHGDGTEIIYPTMGTPHAAARMEDGRLALLVSTALGCELVMREGGSRDGLVLTAEACDQPKLQTNGPSAWIRTGGQALEVVDQQVVREAPASVLSVDPASGARILGAQGDAVFSVELASGASYAVPVPGGLLDAAVRGDHVVALTTSAELVLADALTGELLSTEPFFGSLDVTDLHLTDDGRGLIASGTSSLQFYEVRSPQR